MLTTVSMAGGVRRLRPALLLGVLASAAVAEAPLRVGCCHFPGWYCSDRWVPVAEYGGRDPVLGYYRDASPEVQDWHIRHATQHGVSLWVLDWYYYHVTGTVSEHNAALDQGFLNASCFAFSGTGVWFRGMKASEGRPCPGSRADAIRPSRR